MPFLCPASGAPDGEQRGDLARIVGCWRFWALVMGVMTVCWLCESSWVRHTLVVRLKKCYIILTEHESAKATHATVPLANSTRTSTTAKSIKPARQEEHVQLDTSTESPLTSHATTLMVCTKCTRKDIPGACASSASCLLSGDADPLLLADMEDLMGCGATGCGNASLMSANDMAKRSTSADSTGVSIKTGRKLYHRLRARQLEALAKVDTRTGQTANDIPAGSKAERSSNKVQNNVAGPSNLRIVPVSCLGNCDHGNTIAITAPGKYTYQFGDLDERRPEVLDDIMRFTASYSEHEDGFSKVKTRPTWMKSNVLARIPPLPVPSNLCPDWYDPIEEQRLEASELHTRKQQLSSKASGTGDQPSSEALGTESSAGSRELCECRQEYI